jgi:hypothetical protein
MRLDRSAANCLPTPMCCRALVSYFPCGVIAVALLRNRTTRNVPGTHYAADNPDAHANHRPPPELRMSARLISADRKSSRRART